MISTFLLCPHIICCRFTPHSRRLTYSENYPWTLLQVKLSIRRFPFKDFPKRYNQSCSGPSPRKIIVHYCYSFRICYKNVWLLIQLGVLLLSLLFSMISSKTNKNDILGNTKRHNSARLATFHQSTEKF